MSHSDRDDLQWDVAWEWVIREHDQPLDEGARAQLIDWLKADPAHQRHYEEAHRVWLATALLPHSPHDDDEPENPPQV